MSLSLIHIYSLGGPRNGSRGNLGFPRQAALAGYRLLFGRQLCGQRRVLVLQTGKRAFLLGILRRQAGNGLLQLVQRTLKLRRFGRVAGKMLAHKLLGFQVCSFRGEG